MKARSNTIPALLLPAAMLIAVMLLTSCADQSQQDKHAETHAHTDDAHDSHDDHNESTEQHNDVIKLTDAQLKSAGVVIEPLSSGEIVTQITLPAEIGINQDSVLHVTPRISGIVHQVHAYLGNEVRESDILAIIESPDLGEAKIAYLQLNQSKLIADAELKRQGLISTNTEQLLQILRDNPTPTDLRTQTEDLRIGVNKGRLLSSYAQMKAGYANYARESELNAKGLSTQADLLAAQEMYYSAQAEYMAAFEEIEFTYRITLQEAQQASMIAKSSFENAERRLHLLGLTQDDVDRVVSEPDLDIAKYKLIAPGNGQIVTKHLTPGEHVDTENPVYTIADLSTVWLNISVYAEYAGLIREGQRVNIRVGDRKATGSVEYISALVSEQSRTVHARVVIQNPDREWKPGEFVTVQVETEQSHAQRVVPAQAIQNYEGNEVVFIQDDDGIEPFKVTIGRRSDTTVELLNTDLPIGTPIVISNSFLMKAELGKGAAGHDH